MFSKAYLQALVSVIMNIGEIKINEKLDSHEQRACSHARQHSTRIL